MAIKAPNYRVGPDGIGWFPVVSSEFNLKSAYNIWFDRDFSDGARVFKKLWNINAPKRLKIFLWVVAYDTLLINHVWLRRGLSCQDTFILCGNAPEIMLHALCNCTYAKELWKSIGNSFITISFFQQPLLEWLEKHLSNETRSNLGISWSLLFVIACNSLRHCRNLFIFEGNSNAHAFLAYRVLKIAKDYEGNLNMKGEAKARVPIVVTRQVSWKLPSQN